MIVGKRKSALALLLSVHGSVLPRVLPGILAIAAFSAVVVWIDRHVHALVHADAASFAVFGIALSLFLGFRNNAAYERWWEGRRLWGQLIADSRALGRESEIFLAAPEARAQLVRLMLAFLHLHRLNLRRQPADPAALVWTEPGFLDTPHPPCAPLDAMAELLRAEQAAGRLDGFGARALAERLGAITLAQAGCERIATTPLPYVYSLLVFRTAVLYCLLSPLGLIESAGWLTPLFAAVIAYVFFGLFEVTRELEDPFGETPNSLALNAMCRVVEISLMPRLGLPAPAPMQPEGDFLA
ncbi:MAG: bestrophin family protein [Pararhodobacter sp.]